VGIITFLIGISWAYLAIKVLIPYIRVATSTEVSEATYGYFGRYSLGSTPSDIIKNLILKPQDTLKMLILPANEKAATLILLFLPVGLLSVFSVVMLIALPEIILHFMAPWAAQYLLLWHYSGPITPFAIIAGIYGCSFWLKKKPQFVKNLSVGFTFYILASSILSNYYFGVKALTQELYIPNYYVELYALNNHQTILSFPKEKFKIYYQTAERRRLFERLKEIIPKDASISVQDNLLSHFSQRKATLYPFPIFKDADYVILNTYGCLGDAPESWVTIWADFEDHKKGLNNLFEDTRFQIFFRDKIDEGGIALFGRKERKEDIIRKTMELTEVHSSSSETHFILGSVYALTNNIKKAGVELKTALKLDPENTYAKQMLEAIKSQQKILDKD
ncbi:MAG: DUF2079 domain-containing protein, partial [Candidatus Desantisbacteria bacterium]